MLCALRFLSFLLATMATPSCTIGTHTAFSCTFFITLEKFSNRSLSVSAAAAGVEPLVGFLVLPVHPVGRRNVLRVPIEIRGIADARVRIGDRPDVVVLLRQLGEDDGAVPHLHLQVDADLAPVALHGFGDFRRAPAGKAVELQGQLLAVLVAEAVGLELPAGLVEQPCRPAPGSYLPRCGRRVRIEIGRLRVDVGRRPARRCRNRPESAIGLRCTARLSAVRTLTSETFSRDLLKPR